MCKEHRNLSMQSGVGEFLDFLSLKNIFSSNASYKARKGTEFILLRLF